jgi:predicted metal-dependent hydrolase
MSTSKIAKSFNPKKAVNPEFGKKSAVVEAIEKRDFDKLDLAVKIITEEIEVVAELVKQQNETIKFLFKKLDQLELAIQKNTNYQKQAINSTEQTIVKKLEDLKVEPVEKVEVKVEESKKGWFR